MNYAWSLLKQNVAVSRTGPNMTEYKPHPAAVSYAQRAGYQPDGRAYPGVADGAKSNTATTQTPNEPNPMGGVGQGALPGRGIELMPRPQVINSEPNMQNLGIDPNTGRPMEDEAHEMPYDSPNQRAHAYNQDVRETAHNTMHGDTRRSHLRGEEGRQDAKNILGPIGDKSVEGWHGLRGHSQLQGDLDHHDRSPTPENQGPLDRSRMNRRHVERGSSNFESGRSHDKEGRRKEGKKHPVRDLSKPQPTKNLI